MPYSITRRFIVQAAHRLPDHPGKCARLHGHTYTFEVTVSGPLDDVTGMVTDLAVLEAAGAQVRAAWDHRTLLSENDPLRESASGLNAVYLPKLPTAENLAYLCGQAVQQELGREARLFVTRVRVYEKPDSWAEWSA